MGLTAATVFIHPGNTSRGKNALDPCVLGDEPGRLERPLDPSCLSLDDLCDESCVPLLARMKVEFERRLGDRRCDLDEWQSLTGDVVLGEQSHSRICRSFVLCVSVICLLVGHPAGCGTLASLGDGTLALREAVTSRRRGRCFPGLVATFSTAGILGLMMRDLEDQTRGHRSHNNLVASRDRPSGLL